MEIAYLITSPIILSKRIETTEQLKELKDTEELYIYPARYSIDKQVYSGQYLQLENNSLQTTSYDENSYGNYNNSHTLTILRIGDTIWRRPDEPEKIYINNSKNLTPEQLPPWLTAPKLTPITPEN